MRNVDSMSNVEKNWTQEELDVALRLFQAYWPTAQVPRNPSSAEDTMHELIEMARRLIPEG